MADTKISALTAITAIADSDELAVNDAGVSKKITAVNLVQSFGYTVRIPLTMEVPQGTVAFPDIHALVTGVAKISGMVLPDGASTSTVNFKANVPDNLASTPAASLKFYIMTQGVVCPAGDLRLTVSSIARADTENMDIAEACWQTETETTVTMPVTTETLDIYDQDMTTDPTAGDILMVQLVRDPTDCADDFTDDVIIVGGYLEIDVTPA